jgi:hypothetical protein
VNRVETAQLLTFIATVDKRTIGETDLHAWHTLLEPIDFERAKTSVVSHFRHRPGVWLEPGHIWETAKTTTDADGQDTALTALCDHGTLCRACKAVHHPEESCSILTTQPALRALTATVFREIPA